MAHDDEKFERDERDDARRTAQEQLRRRFSTRPTHPDGSGNSSSGDDQDDRRPLARLNTENRTQVRAQLERRGFLNTTR